MSLDLQLKIVARARRLITDPDHWTKGTIARGRRGVQLPATNPQARKFSAYGALVRAAYAEVRDKGRADKLARAIVENMQWTLGLLDDVQELNHHSAKDIGHPKVLKVFDDFLVAESHSVMATQN